MNQSEINLAIRDLESHLREKNEQTIIALRVLLDWERGERELRRKCDAMTIQKIVDDMTTPEQKQLVSDRLELEQHERMAKVIRGGQYDVPEWAPPADQLDEEDPHELDPPRDIGVIDPVLSKIAARYGQLPFVDIDDLQRKAAGKPIHDAPGDGGSDLKRSFEVINKWYDKTLGDRERAAAIGGNDEG